jgi:hypothetical protein
MDVKMLRLKMSQEWSALTDSAKSKFMKMAQMDKFRSETEMKDYEKFQGQK